MDVSDGNEALVQRILKTAEDLVNILPISIPVEWLKSGLTLAQLRVLLALQLQGDSRMSAIAEALAITLPSATVIVDKLVSKELVTRETDFNDRRQVVCKLSGEGRNLVGKLWLSGKFQMESLLDGLTREELEKAADVAAILYNNVSRKFTRHSGA